MAGGVGRGAADEGLPSHPEITVGLVGPHALLERIVLAAGLPGRSDRIGGDLQMSADNADDVHRADDGSLHRRLLTAAYADEQEAPDKVRRIGSADACLFASPAPLAYARRAGVLRCPAIHIHLADGPLMAALVRATQAGYDPARASFDTFSRPQVMHALAELGTPVRRLHVREEIATPTAMASYHSRLWQLGQTSAAITCLDEVARRLTANQVPVIAVQPSDHAIASALRTATLLAERRVLAAAQLAVALVEVRELRDRARRRAPRQAIQELRLAVHGFLVHEAQKIEATVSPVSEHSFLMIATRGSLATVTAAGGELQFRATAAQTLGVSLDVGIGTGRTEREAEEAARKRLAPGRLVGATSRPRVQARMLLAAAADPADEPTGADPSSQPAAARTVAPPDSLSRLRSLETLTILAKKLAADAVPVVDAELTGQLLSVTPRTARRQLRAMADQGLALPLPPRRSRHPGRPRQAYRLIVEELGREAAR